MGRESEETLFQRRHTDGPQTRKKMLNIIREKQIKTTMRYHFTWIRMARVKKIVTRVDKDVEKKGPGALWVGM